VISPAQDPLPNNTQHSQQSDIYAPGGIRTHNPNIGAAADPTPKDSAATGIGRLTTVQARIKCIPQLLVKGVFVQDVSTPTSQQLRHILYAMYMYTALSVLIHACT